MAASSKRAQGCLLDTRLSWLDASPDWRRVHHPHASPHPRIKADSKRLNVHEVRSVLGHTDIRTTMRYAHLEQAVVTSRARDVINALNRQAYHQGVSMFWIAGGRNSRRRFRRLAGVSSVGLAATLALPLPAGATQCQYFDLDTNELLDRSCTVEYVGEAEVIRIGKKRLRFVESNRQGQWAVGTLDGRPATRYETNRYTFSYATLDLKLFLDRTDE